MNTPHTTSALRQLRTAHRSRGFTLTELMITLAVMSVLLTLSASAFSSIGASSRLSAATNSLVANLHMARSEAIKRNQRVVMCKSPNGVACVTSGGWHQGWIVFNDTNNNGRRDTGEALVYQMDPLPAGMRVLGNLTVAGYVSYSPTGGTKMTSGAFQAGTITVCRESWEATDARQIVLNAAGRPRVQKTTVSSCA